jgi:hypothetical protein
MFFRLMLSRFVTRFVALPLFGQLICPTKPRQKSTVPLNAGKFFFSILSWK